MGKFYCYLLLVFIQFQCSEIQPRPRREVVITRPEVIVILGSSTASGVGASQYQLSWAGLVKENFKKATVINLAKPGYTSYHILATDDYSPANRPKSDTTCNITAALKRRPTTLIISMTTNDVANGFSVEEIINNLAVIQMRALALGVRKVIVTTPHPRKISAAVTGKYIMQRDQVLKTFGSMAVNFFDPVADQDNYFRVELLSKDGLHPNDKGHEVLFAQVKKVLERK